jgi:aryl-alcohol dehydrogenase-like predicted oxidoreductase
VAAAPPLEEVQMSPTALNDYVTIGRSGLRVSPLCLGAMTFGQELGWGSSEEESDAIIDRYLDRGGNFIDTANLYTYGHSEQIIGDHIGRVPSKRDRAVIATKFCGNLFPGDPNGGGAGRKSLVAACHESLRRLQTDYIDLYWMHAWDRFTPIEETLRALDDLVRAGKVRYLGFSDVPGWKLAQAQTIALFRGYTPLAGLQVEYSLLERNIEAELIPAAQELGLGVTPWSPLKSGALSGKYTRDNAGTQKGDRGFLLEGALGEKAYAIVDELIRIAGEAGASAASVALAWVQGRPGVTSTIIGARTVDQLERNLAALSVNLTPAQVRRLDELSEPQRTFPASLQPITESFMHGGITLNGDLAAPSPFVPQPDSPRF